MSLGTIFVQLPQRRIEVSSLFPHVRRSLEKRIFMDPRRMHLEDKRQCSWVGFGVTKGVTSSKRQSSLVALPKRLKRGLHGELIRGFDHTDPSPLCYDLVNHMYGFDDFVRWVYFADPYGQNDILGIDWDINMRSTSGIATSLVTVWKLVATLGAHGIPSHVTVALINPRMVESLRTSMMRHALGLGTMSDWVERGKLILHSESEVCPRCGTVGIREDSVYCSRCGCRPELFWKGVS